MKPLFTGILLTTPVLGLLIFLAIQGREDVRLDVDVRQAEQRVDDARFDYGFASAWNSPGGKVLAPSPEDIKRLQAEADQAKQARKASAELSKEDLAAMRSAVEEAGAAK
ncbi:hypothetical protein GH865_12955 [Rhodocyclus tenuis]|uniref:Uncharacterized protein n=1 Tax=Rhodocyclus tenuis TaxID=1066 RepID=A0A6L5JW65_RHOTE|nr:hypothetical protein [Rhodocyclus gracilis]MQY51306.1 hypothetical protein [Rhodocyclus gracilis]MRD74147.1 hypothetical protein [Rhodocyclus gracilis]